MRYHYWQFLVNQEGQPINNAEISIYLANSETPATIYTGETTTESINTTPQVTTNSNGYFEFWIGDEEETIGYNKGQKFKIVWNRAGIVYGEIDYIDIFPKLEEVDETDSESDYKNKTISNNLAYTWEAHRKHNVITNGFPIHGISFVDVNSTNSNYNKLVSNLLAKGWQDHKNFSFSSATSAMSGNNNAHDLQPVDYDSDDEVYNKLVSNKILKELKYRIIDFEIVNTWDNNGDGTYSVTLYHYLKDEFPSVVCWDLNAKKQIMPTEIDSIDENTTKITVSDDSLHLNIKIIAN